MIIFIHLYNFRMFHRLIKCPIVFYDTNPTGRILNRFTSDMAALDDSLPLTVFEFLAVIIIIEKNDRQIIDKYVHLVFSASIRYYYSG